MHETDSSVGTGSLQFKTSRTIPMRDFMLPVRASQKKPANYNGTSSFQDYLVQFEVTGDLNR